MKLFLFIFLSFGLSHFSQAFQCQMPQLNSYDAPWEMSPDFLTLNFEGPLAGKAFSQWSSTDAQYFSVIFHRDWCQPLETAILCKTPKDALVEMVSSQTKTGPFEKTTLRYFILVLDYDDTGWAFLKIRAQRMDGEPPVTFHTEFSQGSCKVDGVIRYN